jgi:hypothetical protein
MGSRVPAAQLLLPGSMDMWNLAGERFPRMSDSLRNVSAPLPTTDTPQCGIAGANAQISRFSLVAGSLHFVSGARES